MSEQLELVTTIHAVTSNKYTREELEEKAESFGFDGLDEFVEVAKQSAKNKMATDVLDDSLEMVEVEAELHEVGKSS